jgi:hypothetical protein
VLVTELNFEMLDPLATTLEAEVAGLDHAGVHRADRDFVDCRTLNGEKLVNAGPDCGIRRWRFQIEVAAERLQPGMALGHDAVIFDEGALERLSLGQLATERWISAAFVQTGTHEHELAAVVA